ncbi:MAG: hypothetical protein ACT4OO_08830 [Nitrospiraceae bacterium]
MRLNIWVRGFGGHTILTFLILVSCQTFSRTIDDPKTGTAINLVPCGQYVHSFEEAYLHWDLVQPYLGSELKIPLKILPSLQNLRSHHETQARKLCELAPSLITEGQAQSYICRDTFLKNSAGRVQEINMAFEEVRHMNYEDLKKQTARIAQLLTDYHKQFIPLDQPCGQTSKPT